MGDNYFTFNGRCSTEFDLVVERFPAQPKPARKMESVSIPGRNGDLLVDTGGYENVTISYQCYFRGSPEQASRIAAWLYAKAEYTRLGDTYHPGCYRKAVFLGPVDIENYLNRKGRLTIQFSCLPELWLHDGEQPVAYQTDPAVRTYSATIYNPTMFPARPLIRLYGVGAAALTMGDVAININLIDGHLDIDCALGECYKDGVSCNTDVSMPFMRLPTLLPGKNEILIAGVSDQTIEKMVVWPRWWKL